MISSNSQWKHRNYKWKLVIKPVPTGHKFKKTFRQKLSGVLYEYMSGGQAGNWFFVAIMALTRSSSQAKSENLLFSLNFPGESEAKLYYFQGNSKRNRRELSLPSLRAKGFPPLLARNRNEVHFSAGL